ncbi:MAG: hypothetical protein IJ214_02220, partial [Clostridia bacterium]|nr:hypothetical protein [Clostridia bacterium]
RPLHFSSAGDGVYAAEEKICVAELAPAKQIFIPIKFYGRDAKHHSKLCIPKKMKLHFLRGHRLCRCPEEA